MIVEQPENQSIGVKIGSTYTVSAVRGGLNTPVTKVIKSCVVHTVDPVTHQTIDTEVGVYRPESLFPLDKGIIEKDEHIAPTEAIINKLNAPKGARVVAAVPAVEIQNGRDRLKRALLSALSPQKLVLFPEVYCGAVNSLGYFEHNGKQTLRALRSDFVALNLGSTTLEVLIALHGEQKYLNAFTAVCGNMVDHEILDALNNSLGKVIITLPEVRGIKEQFSMSAPQDIRFRVMTRPNGVVEVYTSKPVLKALNKYVLDVATQLTTIMKNTLTAEVIAQVLDTPIVLTGGMGNIPGLPERLEQQLKILLNYEKISVMKQADGHIAPAIGALTLANEINWDRIPLAVRALY